MQRTLIWYVPVIHRGYLDFLARNEPEIGEIFLIPEEFVRELSALKPDIASLSTEEIKNLLGPLGYGNIRIFEQSQIAELSERPLLLVNDQISRALAAKHFPRSDIRWGNVFLRWDTDSVFAEEDPSLPVTKDSFDQQMLQRAQLEAEKSSDWWRQVGAVLVVDGAVRGAAFNEAMPSDHTPYQRGAVRDFLKPGEKPELADTIHAEQKIVAEAAREGQSLRGASLYVTHFPCPVCAKLIARSGISKCYFFQGSSSLRGKELLESAGVTLARVEL